MGIILWTTVLCKVDVWGLSLAYVNLSLYIGSSQVHQPDLAHRPCYPGHGDPHGSRNLAAATNPATAPQHCHGSHRSEVEHHWTRALSFKRDLKTLNDGESPRFPKETIALLKCLNFKDMHLLFSFVSTASRCGSLGNLPSSGSAAWSSWNLWEPNGNRT